MLLFKSLTAAHSGLYTCVVTNTAGKANTSAELAIKGKIRSQTKLTSFFIWLYNELVPFQCLRTGILNLPTRLYCSTDH